MNLCSRNIVWLKGDLRSQDHEPIFYAEKLDIPYSLLYIFEPSQRFHPDYSERHEQFVYGSLMDLQDKLNNSIGVFYGEAEDIFNLLINKYNINQVFSYQESGTQITWKRDQNVKKLLTDNQINWKEFQRDGIVRGIKNRENWDKLWYTQMQKPLLVNSYLNLSKLEVPKKFKYSFNLEPLPKQMQQPGEDNAWKYLQSFVNGRGKMYSKHISKPTQSRTSCSRISPYLAWGNISVRQAYNFVKPYKIRGFLTRLKWRCHFIQKFEVECDYEVRCINRGYELLNYKNNPEFLTAWMKGNTGYPLIDANIRCLINTGWINFRMRAMLVSFLCHHLDIEWQKGSYYLGKLFLDYEPGIHFTQFQMQAGTTGINTIRIYNPLKQAKDHDANGLFIKKWVPELSKLTAEELIEPWMFASSYPRPIIDLKISHDYARKKLWGHRKKPLVKQENSRILKTHVR